MDDLKSWVARGKYWLHIRPGGRGERFAMNEGDGAEWQPLPCLAVTVVDVDGVVFEETRTINPRSARIPVRPRGAGWKAYDSSSDHWTIWRRELRP
jgi:hypothetical protein